MELAALQIARLGVLLVHCAVICLIIRGQKHAGIGRIVRLAHCTHLLHSLKVATSITINSYIDDVVRARSKHFEEETGLSLVNNPEKGMGAPQHVCIAMPSGFFIGGHYSSKGEGF